MKRIVILSLLAIGLLAFLPPGRGKTDPVKSSQQIVQQCTYDVAIEPAIGFITPAMEVSDVNVPLMIGQEKGGDASVSAQSQLCYFNACNDWYRIYPLNDASKNKDFKVFKEVKVANNGVNFQAKVRSKKPNTDVVYGKYKIRADTQREG